MHKVVVLGLDGFNPRLVERWLEDLPNLKKMQQEGIWGDIESTVPPTAPQAWISSQCGKNPGVYGFWDYTYRDDFSYGEPKLVNSKVIDDRLDCLYRILPKMAQKVAIINVPVTRPPPKIPGGYCVSNFMNQSLESSFTWPESLQDEFYNLVGEYIFDVSDVNINYQMVDKDKVLKRIYEMDTQRFTLIKHFIHEKKCDYILAVMRGSERVSHIFYRYFDDKHRYYDPDPRYKNVLYNYYKWIDKKIGEVMEALDPDTVLFVHSAYSIERLDGRINLSEWLIHHGYMRLHEYPTEPTSFKNLNVDWSKTKCWAMGCSGRIYINLKGRETEGIVEPDDYDKLLDELATKIRDIPDEHGKALNTQVFRRDEIHFGRHVEFGPDMLINFDESRWHTNELVGYGRGKIYHFDTLKESDGEGYGSYGYFCVAGSDVPAKGELKGTSLLNVAPTVMDILNLEIPQDMEKPSILAMLKEENVQPSSDREKAVRSRLEALGY